MLYMADSAYLQRRCWSCLLLPLQSPWVLGLAAAQCCRCCQCCASCLRSGGHVGLRRQEQHKGVGDNDVMNKGL